MTLITGDELGAHLGLGTDTTGLLAAAAAAASACVQAYTRQQLLRTEYAVLEWHTVQGGQLWPRQHWEDDAVDSLTQLGGETPVAHTRRGNALRVDEPDGSEVLLQYTPGYSALPADLRYAVLTLAAAMHRRRTAPETDQQKVFDTSSSFVSALAELPFVVDILQRYTRVAI